MKVFGVGMNKTGTTTLGECLNRLGFRHHSFDLELTRAVDEGDLRPVFQVADEYDSFEDWPWPLIYEELDTRYPDARFILTTRKDSATWFNSLKRHADRTGPTAFREIVYGHPMPHGHESEHVQRYEQHNANVRAYFDGRDDLLEVCWEEQAEWEPICEFLDRPIPGSSFPHANESPGILYNTLRNMKDGIFGVLPTDRQK